MTDTYRVTAPYVVLKSKALDGSGVALGYFEGAVVPESVDAEDLARHIRKQMVEKVGDAEAKALAKQQADEEKAAKAAESGEDEDAAKVVAQAEADRAAAEKAQADEDAKAAKEGRPVPKASDSPRGTKTAQAG